MSQKKINIAIIGLGFGSEFIPIYQNHPQANMHAVANATKKNLNAIGNLFGVEKRYRRYEDVLKDPEVDAIHINTPIPDHAAQSIAALKAGKRRLHRSHGDFSGRLQDDCPAVAKKTGLKYMMMETVVYAREFLPNQSSTRKASWAKFSFFRQATSRIWMAGQITGQGSPPCIARRTALVHAWHSPMPLRGMFRSGSGTIRKDLIKHYQSPFAVETTHIKFKNSDLTARIYRSLFDTARQYRESFDVYGDKQAFEWPLVEGEDPVLHTAKKAEHKIPKRVKVKDYASGCPRGSALSPQRGSMIWPRTPT